MRLLLIIGLYLVALCAETLCAVDENRMYFPDEEDYLRIKANTDSSKRAIEAVTTAADAFAVNFFKAVAKTDSGNLVCSPIGTSMALSLLSYGAAGNTRSQLRTALQFPTDDNVARFGFQNLIKTLASYKTVNLKVANSLFLSKEFNLKPSFKDIATKVFNSTADTVDFSDTRRASSLMNAWCAKQTNGLIDDMISPDDVNHLTKAVLLNAVYFKGQWVTKFKPERTSDKIFYDKDYNEKKIPTMFVLGKFRLGSLDEVESNYIELPYKTEDAAHNVSMFVILPWEIEGIDTLEANFHKVTMRQLLLNRRPEAKVRLNLPKFRIESTMHLQQPLETMGMKNLFNEADLSELTDQSIIIDEIKQKAVIEIDEEGSQAAAVTISAAVTLSAVADGIESFGADHPFLVVIGTVSDNPINLFTARFTG